MSDSHALHPRWPPLLKIEISSNGQNCSILSQKVPKFELHKRNDELFNIYDWLSSFRGEDFFLISSPLFSNLHNRSKSEKVQSLSGIYTDYAN
jgi:hypothetical protein